MKSFNFLLSYSAFSAKVSQSQYLSSCEKAKDGKCSVQTVFRCFQLKLAYRLCCLNNFADDVMKAETEEKYLESFACLLFRNFHHATSSTTVLRRRK